MHDIDIDVSGRHSSTQHLWRLFDDDHLAPDLQQASRPCRLLAAEQIQALPDGPELTTGLRKLLEAKDCFVRQAVLAR